MNKNIWVGVVVVFVLAAGGWWYLNKPSTSVTSNNTQPPIQENTQNPSQATQQTSPPSSEPSAAIDKNTLIAPSAKETVTISGTAANVDHVLVIVVRSDYSGSMDAANLLNGNIDDVAANFSISKGGGDGAPVIDGRWTYVANGGFLGSPTDRYKVLVYDFSKSRYPVKDLGQDKYQLLTSGNLTISK